MQVLATSSGKWDPLEAPAIWTGNRQPQHTPERKAPEEKVLASGHSAIAGNAARAEPTATPAASATVASRRFTGGVRSAWCAQGPNSRHPAAPGARLERCAAPRCQVELTLVRRGVRRPGCSR